MKAILSILEGRAVKNITILFYTLIITIQSHAMEQVIYAGAEHGWNSIDKMNNTWLHNGKGGFPDITLRGTLYPTGEDTDLLIHFDTDIRDETGSYHIEKNTVRLTDRYSAIGSGSGVFINGGGGIGLIPGRNSLFAPGSAGDTFTIEFWLYPAHSKDNEEIITFRGSTRNKENRIIPQEFICSIEDRKLTWDFTNFFFNPQSYTSRITISGIEALIPEEWHHHMLIFHSTTGLMEYYVDNKLEGVTYVTSTGRDGGTPLIPLIGSFSFGSLVIGKTYSGFIDEFRILKKIEDNPVLSPFQGGYGTAETKLFDMGRNGSRLEKIDIDADTPGNSTVSYFYRVFNDFQHTIQKHTEWEPFIPGRYLNDMNTGRFFEIRLQLYADGEGTFSPKIHTIKAFYDRNLPPLAPVYLTAQPGDRSITLTWDDIGESDIEGYLVYYGTESGNYFGKEAIEGASPIPTEKRNSLTLHGLTNGKLYYFTVAAYDTAGISYPGELSKEISSRPHIIVDRDN